jgi:hypothetical protein
MKFPVLYQVRDVDNDLWDVHDVRPTNSSVGRLGKPLVYEMESGCRRRSVRS